jgi:hypothetical protein
MLGGGAQSPKRTRSPVCARSQLRQRAKVFAANAATSFLQHLQDSGKLATQKKLCYLVDYQMGTDPINIEVVKRIHEGGLGKLGHLDSLGFSPPWGEPPIKTAEDRLRWWLATTALSGDVITENTVHSINAVLWIAGKRPVNAIGRTRVVRPDPRSMTTSSRAASKTPPCSRPATMPSPPCSAARRVRAAAA